MVKLVLEIKRLILVDKIYKKSGQFNTNLNRVNVRIDNYKTVKFIVISGSGNIFVRNMFVCFRH